MTAIGCEAQMRDGPSQPLKVRTVEDAERAEGDGGPIITSTFKVREYALFKVDGDATPTIAAHVKALIAEYDRTAKEVMRQAAETAINNLVAGLTPPGMVPPTFRYDREVAWDWRTGLSYAHKDRLILHAHRTMRGKARRRVLQSLRGAP